MWYWSPIIDEVKYRRGSKSMKQIRKVTAARSLTQSASQSGNNPAM